MGEGSQRRRGMTAQRFANGPMRALLRSPAHGIVSRKLMIISVAGRRTGRQITLPVGYVEHDGDLLVYVGDHETKRWWRNLEGGAPVELTLRGKRVPARARVLDAATEEAAVVEALGAYARGSPAAAKQLGIALVDGEPDPASVRAAAPKVRMVVAKPDGAG